MRSENSVPVSCSARVSPSEREVKAQEEIERPMGVGATLR
jgi:hypothetical protein